MAFSQLSPMIQNQIRRNPTNLARAVRRPAPKPAYARPMPTRPTPRIAGGGSRPVPRPDTHGPATVKPIVPIKTGDNMPSRTSASASGTAPVQQYQHGQGGTPPSPHGDGAGAFDGNTHGAPLYSWLQPYAGYTGFMDWWGNHRNQYANDPAKLGAVLKQFQDDSWRSKTTDFQTWLNSQPNVGLLGQGFDAQKAAYIAAHGGQAGQILGQGYANLYDPKYMQAISELLLRGGNTNTAPMSELAGLMTPNASGISPYAAAMLENLRKHSAQVGSNASYLARRGLYGGGGAQDYAMAGAGAALQSANQDASKTWGPDKIAALGQQIIQNLQNLNTDQYAALTDALSRGLGGIPNPQVTGGVPDWTKLLGQWGSV